MRKRLAWIKANYRELIIGLLCFSVFFIFEAYQQLFYARNFSVSGGSDVTIKTILNAHLFRWLIWGLLSLILIYYVNKKPIKRDKLGSAHLIKYLLVISLVLFLNLLGISLAAIVTSESSMSIAVFSETFIFFFYHKTPLYFIMLLALTVLVHFFINREVLELTIDELGQLKFSHEQLYEEIKQRSFQDESFVLQVKTGSRTKLVPVEEIIWIEADDYCVRIYDQNNHTHTLRSSMKALDEKLEYYGFIRVHRKAIVNMSFVSEFIQNGKTEIVLKNNQTIAVAQSRLIALKSALHTI